MDHTWEILRDLSIGFSRLSLANALVEGYFVSRLRSTFDVDIENQTAQTGDMAHISTNGNNDLRAKRVKYSLQKLTKNKRPGGHALAQSLAVCCMLVVPKWSDARPPV